MHKHQYSAEAAYWSKAKHVCKKCACWVPSKSSGKQIQDLICATWLRNNTESQNGLEGAWKTI